MLPWDTMSQESPSCPVVGATGSLQVLSPAVLTEHFCRQPSHPDWQTGSHLPAAAVHPATGLIVQAGGTSGFVSGIFSGIVSTGRRSGLTSGTPASGRR